MDWLGQGGLVDPRQQVTLEQGLFFIVELP